ncbi:methyltransferase [Streptomyces sp. NPDC090021]|uniref:methyltransferase n=1 Tax=Streptomyces sp. NPDC090021 TaxID=3365919 RepID=UPI00381D2FB6
MDTTHPAPDGPPPGLEEHLAAAALYRLAFGFMPAQMIHVAARLRIPDLLAEGPRTATELAKLTGSDARALHRVLRGLVAFDVLAEPEAGTFELTLSGRLLRSDVPNSVRPMLMPYFDEGIWGAWGALSATVRTGGPALEQVRGVSLFDYLAQQPAVSSEFNEAMALSARLEAPAVALAHDFARYRTAVDLGGGNGTLMANLLAAHPQLRGTLFDTPTGLAEAPSVLAAHGVADRCEIAVGDFFASVPDGADVYLLKSVLHDWDDEQCIRILRNCRGAVPADGRLLVVEVVMPERMTAQTDHFSVISDINLLATTSGRERTAEEFRRILTAGGFEPAGIGDPIGFTGYRIIEAVPAAH